MHTLLDQISTAISWLTSVPQNQLATSADLTKMAVLPAYPMTKRELFGGAITAPFPSSYVDASDLRQIPDTQEVFLSQTSDTSTVLEILELVTSDGAREDLWAAAKYHFDSLAHDNASLSTSILTPTPDAIIPSKPSQSATTPTPIFISGLQSIHKFSHNPSGAPRPGHEADNPDQVWIGMALWRCWHGSKRADVVLSVNVNLSATGGEAEREAVEQWFMLAVQGLTIEDWGLFADGD